MPKQPDPRRPAAGDGGVRIKPVKFEPPAPARSRFRLSFRIGSLAVAALLAASVFATWFLFTARAVYIEIEPQEAVTRIDSPLKLKLADRYLLRPGAYQLRLSAPGYHPQSEQLVVGHAQNQHFTFRMRRLPGHLHVETGAVQGADVYLDDVLRGKTPLTLRDIPPGEHQLRIEADRYLPHRQSIVIEGLDRRQELAVELQAAWAVLTLNSEPVGAEVTVDDAPVGVTPLQAQVLQGTHLLRIKASGFKDWQKELSVVAGEPLAFDVSLAPADAVVYLVSVPPGANTTVDGEYKGLTPLELALSPGKAADLRLFKQGYEPASKTLTAQPGDRQRLTIRLQPILAKLAVEVEPADAQVFVDGELAGAGSQVLKLPARKHQIEVRKAGYVDYKSAVTLETGIDQRLRVELKTVKQARREAVKTLITTSDGQTLKLFYPGEFTMGASRREPGRRANETLRKVKLTRPFYLGVHEVTNEAYREYDKTHAAGQIRGYSLEGERHPVVSVTWEQAALYCNWLSQRENLRPFYKLREGKPHGFDASANGYRLPTEAEWAWAARVRTDNTLLKFPWGDEMPPPKNSGNFADESASSFLGRVLYKYDDGHPVTATVGSFPPNSRGLYDMGGNVAEWVNDFYDISPGYQTEVKLDPMGPDSGEFHVIRGSSWAHGTITELRLSYRDYGNQARDDLGFRIARYLE